MANRTTLRIPGSLIGYLLTASTLAWGQGEVSGFGGWAWMTDYGGNHPIYGAAMGVNLGRYVQLLGEYSRLPLTPLSFSTYTQGSIHASQRYDNFGGGVQVRFLSGKKVEPYILAPCIGAGRLTASSSNSAYNSATTDLYVGVGGGVRFFAGKKWGIRPEYRILGYVEPGNFFGRSTSVHVVTVGLFFQFGGG